MAVDINDSVLQLGRGCTYYKGYYVCNETYIGPDDAVNLSASTYHTDYKFSVGTTAAIVTDSIVEKIEADRSKWKFTYRVGNIPGREDSDGDPDSDDVLDITWSCQMSQYSFPLERYLTSEEVATLMKWEFDTPFDHKKAYEYKKYPEDTSWTALAGNALKVAKWKINGTTEVLRHYPQVSRTTTYGKLKVVEGDPDIDTKDSTPDSKFNGFGVEWLKIGSDWCQNPNGTWTHTESWLGGEVWDSDMYKSLPFINN